MNQVISSSEKWDRDISFCIILYYIISSVNGVLKSILLIPESLWGIVSFGFGLIFLYFFLMNLKKIYYRSSRILLGLLFIFAVIYLISILQVTLRGEPFLLLLKGSLFLTFAWWIPLGVATFSVNDKNILYVVLLRGSYIISGLQFLNLFFGNSNGQEEVLTYNMFFGYSIAFPLLLHINEFFRTKKKWFLFIVICEFIALVSYASRGPLLSVSFLLGYILLVENRSLKKCIVLIFLGGIFYFAFDRIIEYIVLFGVKSRTLSLLAANEIASDSGRGDIWNVCLQMIQERPFLGWGLGGEYYGISKGIGEVVPTVGATPHNGLLQLLVNFGVLLGSFIGIIIIFSGFVIHRVTDYYHRRLLVIFFSLFILPCLTVGSGFFTNSGVAMYLLLWLQVFRDGKNIVFWRLLGARY